MKPLLYRKKDKVTGIYAYCQKCKTCIGTGKCRKTNKRLSSCGYPDFHTFRASVIVPNTQGRKRKKRILNTKDLQEAIRLKLVFEEELKGHNFQIPPESIIDRAIEPVEVIEAIEVPLGVVEQEDFDEHEGLLIEFMDQYIGFLNNEGVEEHKVKIRTKKHIDDVKRYFKFFCLALKGKGIDHTDFRISELNDRIVGYVHAYLLHELNYQNKTYNKVMSLFRQFIGWIISERGIVIKNPFKGVNKKKEKKDDTIVTKEELHGLLGVIKPENGWNISPSGKRRYYYRGWVKTAIMIALETGLRREEFAKLKFSDVQVDENGNAYCIRVENYKVNRIKGISDEYSKDIKTIPITAKMRGILKGLDFESHIGSERFLIAPDEKVTRATIGEFTSKAFTHFWNCTGSKRKVNLKHLRKTYLTALVNHFGDKATVISDHADIEVLKKHYTNNEVIMKANQGFNIFG